MNRFFSQPKKFLGFTLVEMLIVVAIIGILAAIALPSYQAYIEKTDLADAKKEIINIKQNLESDRLLHPKNYTTSIHYTTKLTNEINNIPNERISKIYRVSQFVEVTDGKIFKIYLQAIPVKTGYKYGIWVDNGGNAFRCPKASLQSQTSATKPSSCESL